MARGETLEDPEMDGKGYPVEVRLMVSPLVAMSDRTEVESEEWEGSGGSGRVRRDVADRDASEGISGTSYDACMWPKGCEVMLIVAALVESPARETRLRSRWMVSTA